PPLLQAIIHTRSAERTTRDLPPLPKVLPTGLPLSNELPEVKMIPDTPTNLNQYPNMSRRMLECRGVETIHNKLIHKQYGIMALAPGLMTESHFNTMRNMTNKRIDMTRCFAIWRVDPPWKPWYFHGLNKKRGTGKGSIDFFVTPVKINRIIIEVGGTIPFEQLYRTLLPIAESLPFPAIPVSQELLDKFEKERNEIEEKNLNPLRWEYLIRNNVLKCHRTASMYDIEFARFGPKIR
ncbi:unnamed protein product, partial [Didymodactylos carnosus]